MIFHILTGILAAGMFSGHLDIPIYLALIPSLLYTGWKVAVEVFYMSVAVLAAFLVVWALNVYMVVGTPQENTQQTSRTLT